MKFKNLIHNVRIALTFTSHNIEINDLQDPATFETAIAATGFGKFNFVLFLAAFPPVIAMAFATAAIGFVVPIAECDLHLTLENKGVLNGITYFGMITSGFFWGYLSDTIGRRKLLVTGCFCNGLVVLASGFSQHYMTLVVLKYLEGFIINGPFAVLISYLNEFHSAKYRSFIPAANGVIIGIGGILLPVLAWSILFKPIEIIITDIIVLHSWNIFLVICSVPSLIAGFAFLMLPESPKFQMTMGDDNLAYATFQKIYAWNSGNSPDKYPIKFLLPESRISKSEESSKSKIQAIKGGFKQLIPLFYPPLLNKLILVTTIDILIMLGLNTLRLWLPQIFAAITNYEALYSNEQSEVSLCQMLEILHPNKTTTKNENCTVNYNIQSAYVNNIIVSLTQIGCFVFAAVTTRLVGKKFVLAYFSVIGGVGGICMYFAQNTTTVVILSSLCVGFSGVSAGTMLSVVVDIFPTSLRTIAVALVLVFGRSGSMIGNLIFPSLLVAGCLPTFVTIGSLIVGGGILALALPKTDTKDLE